MKIILITPYGGSNLGDAAIQEAVIYNIRKRYPDAEILMVTLNPEKTSQLHDVVSFPITSLTIEHYFSSRFLNKKNQYSEDENLLSKSRSNKEDTLSNVKIFIKKCPWLFSTLKSVQKFYLKIISIPSIIFKEISHFFKAFKFTKDVDLFLVSGGGQIDDYWGGPWGHPYSLFKWGLVAKAVGARYAFLGVGTCTLESKLSVFFIRHALGMAAYRSYRDEVSKSLLKDFSFTRNDPVCPDLVWSLDGKRVVPAEDRNMDSGMTVGVSPIAYLRQNWPKKNIQVYENYLKNLTDFTANLIRKDFSIVFFLSAKQDHHVVREMLEIFAGDNTLNFSGKVRQVRTETLDELLACLSAVDCVVASRLHGALLAHLVRKPVLAISYDRKVDTYMKDTGFSRYCFDIHNFKVDSLKKAFEVMFAESHGIEVRLKELGEDYSRHLDCQYDIILGL